MITIINYQYIKKCMIKIVFKLNYTVYLHKYLTVILSRKIMIGYHMDTIY